MIASQSAHINQLVQKTQTLDNTIKDLQGQLTNSRAQWQVEHREWIDGCDSLMGCHRIAHLRTNVRLAQERVAVAHERDLLRRERVAVIQRDYNLILFKAKEKELEIEADHLREELRNATNGNVALVAQLKNKLADGMRELKETATLLRDAEKAREEAEVGPLNTASTTYSYSRLLFRSRQPTYAPNTLHCRVSFHLLAQPRRGLRCASRMLKQFLQRRNDCTPISSRKRLLSKPRLGNGSRWMIVMGPRWRNCTNNALPWRVN